MSSSRDFLNESFFFFFPSVLCPVVPALTSHLDIVVLLTSWQGWCISSTNWPRKVLIMEPSTSDDDKLERKVRRDVLAQKIAGIAAIYAIEKVIKLEAEFTHGWRGAPIRIPVLQRSLIWSQIILSEENFKVNSYINSSPFLLGCGEGAIPGEVESAVLARHHVTLAWRPQGNLSVHYVTSVDSKHRWILQVCLSPCAFVDIYPAVSDPRSFWQYWASW